MRTWTTELKCPRCAVAMFGGELDGFALLACGRCAGVWLDEKTRHRVGRKQRSGAVRLAEIAMRRGKHLADTTPRIDCPVCSQRMKRRRLKGTDLVVDACREHGTWFDRGELPEVAATKLDRRLARAEAALVAQVGQADLDASDERALHWMKVPKPRHPIDRDGRLRRVGLLGTILRWIDSPHSDWNRYKDYLRHSGDKAELARLEELEQGHLRPQVRGL